MRAFKRHFEENLKELIRSWDILTIAAFTFDRRQVLSRFGQELLTTINTVQTLILKNVKTCSRLSPLKYHTLL